MSQPVASSCSANLLVTARAERSPEEPEAQMHHVGHAVLKVSLCPLGKGCLGWQLLVCRAHLG